MMSLWFVNNAKLDHAILGAVAKYTNRYQVQLYALAIEGNHIQAPAHFPLANRANFMRDLNSYIAKAVDRLTPEYPGGRLFARRYSNEFLPSPEDIEAYFFYTVLQPVQDGLVADIADYPGYNCFLDAVYGIERKFKLLDQKAYRRAKRRNPEVRKKDFIRVYTLKYARIPGYEHLSQQEYAKMMFEKLKVHQTEEVRKREAEGKGFLGRKRLLRVARGSLPKNPKKSSPTKQRPRVLSRSRERRDECLDWYFHIYFKYKDASKRYLDGELDVEFPQGTYKPYLRVRPPPVP